MEAIHIASTPAELYNAVLVDTPLAPFFQSCINEQVICVHLYSCTVQRCTSRYSPSSFLPILHQRTGNLCTLVLLYCTTLY